MIYFGVFFAFIGYAFTKILMNDLLWGYKKYLVENLILPEWIKNPMGLCSVCFTGQLSLWGMTPMVQWSYSGVLVWLGIVSLNMIIVKIIDRYVETD